MTLAVNGSTHLIPAYYSFYRPRKDERLSWPSWLNCSGWLTHISGHPSAAGRAQDRESSPARDRRSTTVPRQIADPLRGLLYSESTTDRASVSVLKHWSPPRHVLDRTDQSCPWVGLRSLFLVCAVDRRQKVAVTGRATITHVCVSSAENNGASVGGRS